jgi:hypothetical protein
VSVTKAELEANFESFSVAWKGELPKVISSLGKHRDEFLKSYSRIASINAWRNVILETRISEASLEFFSEALNDAVTSHVFAQFGTWRSALMSLRSCIENVSYCLFYMDHPVELRLWGAGRHRPGFSETLDYLEHHPDVAPLGNSPVTGLASLKEEYSTLSRAVHASAKGFRMSSNGPGTVLWKPDAASLALWRTREQHTLVALNLLLTAIFRDLLAGTQQPSLRKALGGVIPTSMHAKVKTELKVTILTP